MQNLGFILQYGCEKENIFLFEHSNIFNETNLKQIKHLKGHHRAREEKNRRRKKKRGIAHKNTELRRRQSKINKER